MVSHARVNDGLSQTPAPGRRPSLEEKSHPWSLPRRHRSHVLFDMVPLLWSLPTIANVSFWTNLREVWKGFRAAGYADLEVSVKERKCVHLCCFLGHGMRNNKISGWGCWIKCGKLKKNCRNMSPAIMGALYCIYSGLHLFIYLSNGECALQWPSSQTVKALSALVLPACDFRVEKHKLIVQNSPQKWNKCSNLCLIHTLFYSLFLWGWLRTWL